METPPQRMGDPSLPNPLVTYGHGGLQSISRYHFDRHARFRQDLHRFLHASPRRVDDPNQTQKRQTAQL